MKLAIASTAVSLCGALLLLAVDPEERAMDGVDPKVTEAPGRTSDPAFDKMMDVLLHERCVNCHPSDNRPKQGDDAHHHYFGVARGSGEHENLGFEATKCTTCHGEENNDFSGVPGAPEWSLAPDSMRWEGLSRREIAESILDPERNGGRDHAAIEHHLTEHALVLWAWEPGINADGVPREKPPVPVDEYIEAVKAWFHDGANIPAEAQ